MDRIVQSLELQFVQHKQLYKDLSCLDPAKFKTTAEKGLEDEALEGNLYYEVVSLLDAIMFSTHDGQVLQVLQLLQLESI
jgi:hypothetical protein